MSDLDKKLAEIQRYLRDTTYTEYGLSLAIYTKFIKPLEEQVAYFLDYGDRMSEHAQTVGKMLHKAFEKLFAKIKFYNGDFVGVSKNDILALAEEYGFKMEDGNK